MDTIDIQGMNLVGNDWGIEPETSYLIFEVGRRRIAIDAQYVQEVVRYTGHITIQNSNPLVTGVIHHRRDFLALFDLGKAFSGETSLIPTEKAIVILAVQGCAFGMIAERIVDFAGISETAFVSGALEDTEIAHNEFFQGVAIFEQKPILLMNPVHLLNRPQSSDLDPKEFHNDHPN